MSTVAFIFARGGSKGLPGKNVRKFNGKPLIAWAIEHANAVSRIEKVIVSTDSQEIAEIARRYGADVPFMRPLELASDNAPEWLAWQHALNYFLKTKGKLPDVMVSIPTTAPLRMPIDIEKCLDEYEKGGADVVITMTDSNRNPYFNMVYSDQSSNVKLVIPPQSVVSRRQDAPKVYDVSTVCYVANPNYVMTHASVFEGRVKGVTIPLERAVDIDTLLDFEWAEYLMKRNR
jgi:N-acylneuraminate cytidylyltransferase